MKSKKWLWGILITLLAIVLLAGAGFAGYRLGLTQNPAVIKQLAELRAQKLNAQGQDNAPQQNSNGKAPKSKGQVPGQMWDRQNPPMQGFDQRGNFQRGYDPRFGSGRGFDRGHRESPLFGLLHLIVLGALLWLVYKFAKNSGWKLVREVQPTPVASEAVNTGEKKNKSK